MDTKNVVIQRIWPELKNGSMDDPDQRGYLRIAEQILPFLFGVYIVVRYFNTKIWSFK